MTSTDIKIVRETLESAFKKMLEPYLQKSEFLRKAVARDRSKLRLWMPKNLAGKATLKVYPLLGGLLVKEFQGFSEDGVVLACEGESLDAVKWANIPVEDLFRLQDWALVMIPKLTRFEHKTKCARAAHASRSSYQLAN